MVRACIELTALTRGSNFQSKFLLHKCLSNRCSKHQRGAPQAVVIKSTRIQRIKLDIAYIILWCLQDTNTAYILPINHTPVSGSAMGDTRGRSRHSHTVMMGKQRWKTECRVFASHRLCTFSSNSRKMPCFSCNSQSSKIYRLKEVDLCALQPLTDTSISFWSAAYTLWHRSVEANVANCHSDDLLQ